MTKDKWNIWIDKILWTLPFIFLIISVVILTYKDYTAGWF